MQANRGRDTRPELALRSEVHRRGLRYRVSARPIPGWRRTADLVFRPVRVAVFLDGCFWHGCPTHGTRPVTNAEFWTLKIDGNIKRDRDTDTRLSKNGWVVLRFWEHEDPAAAADLVETVVRRRRKSG